MAAPGKRKVTKVHITIPYVEVDRKSHDPIRVQYLFSSAFADTTPPFSKWEQRRATLDQTLKAGSNVNKLAKFELFVIYGTYTIQILQKRKKLRTIFPKDKR